MPRALFAILLAGHLYACAGDDPAHRSARKTLGSTPMDGPVRCGRDTFELTTPDGWRAAPRPAAAHHMLAAFHPADDTWESARVVMAVRCDPGSTPCTHLVARDKERFAKRSRLVVLGEAEPVRTAAGHRLELRTFSGGPDGRTEAIAYLKVRGGTLRLIMRAANQPAFEVHLPAFEALLGSLRRAE